MLGSGGLPAGPGIEESRGVPSGGTSRPSLCRRCCDSGGRHDVVCVVLVSG